MNDLARLERLDDYFPDLFRRLARMPFAAPDASAEIKVDVTENDKDYQVRAIVPGARKEDIRVSVDRNYVAITAEVRREKEQQSGRSLLKESYHGSASRGFTLAHDIDDKAVVAKLEDGVLKLTLPKRAGTGAQPIAIQ